MKQKIKLITAVDMLFIFLFCVSGASGGIISELLYYLAFSAPVIITLNYLYRGDKSLHGDKGNQKNAITEDLTRDFSLSKRTLLFTLPVIFPAIALIFLFSFLTSLLLGAFGYENATVFEEHFLICVLTHALVPAILEELLFRFIPIKLLSENKKTALLISAVMFSFAHTNLFQIPYAFLAGIIFAALYLVTGSIIPSMILHFLNNFISLISIYGYGGVWLVPTLIALAILSLIPIFIKRKDYIRSAKELLGGEKIVISYAPLAFIAMSLFLSITMLFA